MIIFCSDFINVYSYVRYAYATCYICYMLCTCYICYNIIVNNTMFKFCKMKT